MIDTSIDFLKICAIILLIGIYLERRTEIGKYVYVRNKKNLPHEPGIWDKKKQMAACTTYLATGSIAETSRIINVPYRTVQEWTYSDWWKQLMTEIQSGENQKTDNKMSKVIEKTLDMLVSRIEEGDYQYDQKTGRLVKIPLKARDLERITSGLFDKRQLIRKQPTNIKQDDLNQADRLLKLAEQFAKFSGVKREEKELEVVKDEYIEGEWNAVHDEREAGLQEGTEVGTYQEEDPR